MYRGDWVGYGLIGACIVLIVLCFIGSYYSYQDWQIFKVEHNCKVVAHIDGSSTVGVGIGTNGQMSVVPVYVPGKTGWLCDDGVTYYK